MGLPCFIGYKFVFKLLLFLWGQCSLLNEPSLYFGFMAFLKCREIKVVGTLFFVLHSRGPFDMTNEINVTISLGKIFIVVIQLASHYFDNWLTRRLFPGSGDWIMVFHTRTDIVWHRF